MAPDNTFVIRIMQKEWLVMIAVKCFNLFEYTQKLLTTRLLTMV